MYQKVIIRPPWFPPKTLLYILIRCERKYFKVRVSNVRVFLEAESGSDCVLDSKLLLRDLTLMRQEYI